MFSKILVELIDHMGSDNTVVNSARVSFDKEAQQYSEEQNAGLIDYLAKHGHWTPFAHATITLRETVPIFVARQRFKHTVGFTYNEVSRRYVDDDPTFLYMFDTWRARPEASIKQGSGGSIPNPLEMDHLYTSTCDAAYNTYHAMLASNVAPEQARAILPQCMMTSYYVTGSLYAFARMYTQRIDGHAQQEIQDLAKLIHDEIAPLYPLSWAALTGIKHE